MARAHLVADGHYQAYPPEPVGEPGGLLPNLRAQAGEGNAVLVGFDFPIGLPLAYARRAGIENFLSTLPELGKSHWSQFYEPASSPSEINIVRPFYPARPGGCRQAHLIEHLGVETMNDLRRCCELAHKDRRAACPLFWTLGAQQVGKAAISGWRDVLVGQAGLFPGVAIWPFSGRLADLLAKGGVVLAETYPGEFYNHLGVRFSRRRLGERSGKRAQLDRIANAATLLAWADQASVEIPPDLKAAMREGFGPSPNGEDPFDALVGLLGMLNVVLGLRPPGEPEDEKIRKIEGWILGQEYVL